MLSPRYIDWRGPSFIFLDLIRKGEKELKGQARLKLVLAVRNTSIGMLLMGIPDRSEEYLNDWKKTVAEMDECILITQCVRYDIASRPRKRGNLYWRSTVSDFVTLFLEHSDFGFGAIFILVSDDGTKARLFSLEILFTFGPFWNRLIFGVVSLHQYTGVICSRANCYSDECKVQVQTETESQKQFKEGSACQVLLRVYPVWGLLGLLSLRCLAGIVDFSWAAGGL
jgi:hypothetical protein